MIQNLVIRISVMLAAASGIRAVLGAADSSGSVSNGTVVLIAQSESSFDNSNNQYLFQNAGQSQNTASGTGFSVSGGSYGGATLMKHPAGSFVQADANTNTNGAAESGTLDYTESSVTNTSGGINGNSQALVVGSGTGIMGSVAANSVVDWVTSTLGPKMCSGNQQCGGNHAGAVKTNMRGTKREKSLANANNKFMRAGISAVFRKPVVRTNNYVNRRTAIRTL